MSSTSKQMFENGTVAEATALFVIGAIVTALIGIVALGGSRDPVTLGALAVCVLLTVLNAANAVYRWRF